jgi:hypothetical protein
VEEDVEENTIDIPAYAQRPSIPLHLISLLINETQMNTKNDPIAQPAV